MSVIRLILPDSAASKEEKKEVDNFLRIRTCKILLL